AEVPEGNYHRGSSLPELRDDEQIRGSHKMSTATDQDVILGQEPNHEETELVTWAEETMRKSLDTVRDGLRQLVTLSTALLAGSAAFLGQLPVHPFCKGLTACLLMLTLGCALWGSLPRVAAVDVHYPAAIKREREEGTAAKLRCLQCASGSLLFAFVSLFVGLLF